MDSLPAFLDPQQAAEALQVTNKTIRRWCESEKIKAITKPYGPKRQTWIIPKHEVERLHREGLDAVRPERPTWLLPDLVPVTNHLPYYPGWVHAMQNGTLTGRKFSNHTVALYTHYLKPYLEAHPMVHYGTVRQWLAHLDTYSCRQHFHRAIVSFGKHLLDEQVLFHEMLQQIVQQQPKRHEPPKRTGITEAQLEQLIEACQNPQDRLLLQLLAMTGLRASEAVGLDWSDVDFENRVLFIRKAKWGKARKLGVPGILIETLRAWKEATPNDKEAVFLNIYGTRIDRYGIRHRLQKLGKPLGIEVHPHALRRAFVTINAHKGRSLAILKDACGHSSITTTMSYCLTTEQAVIQAMQDWD